MSPSPSSNTDLATHDDRAQAVPWAIVAALIRHDPMTLADLQAMLNVPTGDVAAALEALLKEDRPRIRMEGDLYFYRTPREQCERQVELHDGTVVGSWSEEWRAETEALGVLQLPTKMARQGYMIRVRQRRGDEAANALEELALKIWRANRDAEDWCG